MVDVDKVDVITDLVGSASALAVSALGNERKKVILVTNGATAELNQKQCGPFSIQYRSDTYAEAKSTANDFWRRAERAGSSSPRITRSGIRSCRIHLRWSRRQAER